LSQPKLDTTSGTGSRTNHVSQPWRRTLSALDASSFEMIDMPPIVAVAPDGPVRAMFAH
jgi:hypothetical protein